MSKNLGKIKQVLGAIVDVSFEDKLPQILDALVVKHEEERFSFRSCSTFRRKYC